MTNDGLFQQLVHVGTDQRRTSLQLMWVSAF
jgi:hypothetical protein